ncbi:MAG: hypothetical protein U0Z53_23800 [Blastocatellia bacterium]
MKDSHTQFQLTQKQWGILGGVIIIGIILASLNLYAELQKYSAIQKHAALPVTPAPTPPVSREQQEQFKRGLREIRRATPHRIEDVFLRKGIDLYAKVSGPEDTTLTIKYVLMSRPFVYKAANETDFLENMRVAGFRKIVFTDGGSATWIYDLQKGMFI